MNHININNLLKNITFDDDRFGYAGSRLVSIFGKRTVKFSAHKRNYMGRRAYYRVANHDVRHAKSLFVPSIEVRGLKGARRVIAVSMTLHSIIAGLAAVSKGSADPQAFIISDAFLAV